MKLNVTVLGSGSWGTTVASIATRRASTLLWSRRPEQAEEIRTAHTNERYLPGFTLPTSLDATDDLERAVHHADVLVMGVPSHGFRQVLEEVRPLIRPWVPVVSLTKGLEQGTHLRMTEIIGELLPGHPAGVLTGPNIAREIMAGYAAASVLAMESPRVVSAVQKVFNTGLFRVYTNDDVVGCEVGGALKNVIAIASGMADGVGVGNNTRAAVVTRGLAELTRLGVAMGGEPLTFSGLAGMGDLMVTAISQHSRNRHVGEQLGKGNNIDDIINAMHMVAEGVKTSKVVMKLSEQLGVEMPIATEVYNVIHRNDYSAIDAYRGLVRGQEAGAEYEPG
ncbi:MAG: NAD(P)H-dependent glycerol-3-phosphate dehydrogenase [Myxococcota bacterium]